MMFHVAINNRRLLPSCTWTLLVLLSMTGRIIDAAGPEQEPSKPAPAAQSADETAALVPPQKPQFAGAARSLVVLSKGRQKPLATHAREEMEDIFGYTSDFADTAVAFSLSMMFEAETWLDFPCFEPGPHLSERMFQEKQLVSAKEIFSREEEMRRIVSAYEHLEAGSVPVDTVDAEKRGRLRMMRNEIYELHGRAVALYEVLADIENRFCLVPDPENADGEWLSVRDLRTRGKADESMEGKAADERAEKLQKLFSQALDAFEALRTSYLNDDIAGFAKDLAEVKTLQEQAVSYSPHEISLLPAWSITVELLFFSVDRRHVGLGLFSLCVLLYIAAAFAKGNTLLYKAAFITLWCGIAWNLWIIAGRTAIAGRLPLKNLQEVYLVVLFFLPLIGVVLSAILRTPLYTAVAAFLTVVGFTGSLFLETYGYRIKPLVAILHSPWREVHILTIMFSYAVLLVAAGLHAAFLVVAVFARGARTAEGGKPVYSKTASDLDRQAYFLIVWGVLFLAAGIATGAAWGQFAWGRYWGWDPKETWAAVALVVYLLFLHLRIFFRVPKEVLALVSLLGYAAILFTYFGVTYLLPGLHAYS